MPAATTEKTKKKIIELRKAGLTYREIAAEVGCSQTNVMNVCQAAGVKKSTPHRMPPKRSKRSKSKRKKGRGKKASEASDDSSSTEVNKSTDLYRMVLDELEDWRAIRDQCVTAKDDVGVARASKQIASLLPVALRLKKMSDGEVARPMPSEEELAEIARTTRARLFDYVERAAEGK